MAQVNFPPGVSEDFPPEESPVEGLIGIRIKEVSALFGADREERKDGEL